VFEELQVAHPSEHAAGFFVGFLEGWAVGFAVGDFVGVLDGWSVGFDVGFILG